MIITYITLAFFLLPDKETISYTEVFNYISIIEKCFKFKLEFSPEYIYSDFKKAIHKAASQVLATGQQLISNDIS